MKDLTPLEQAIYGAAFSSALSHHPLTLEDSLFGRTIRQTARERAETCVLACRMAIGESRDTPPEPAESEEP